MRRLFILLLALSFSTLVFSSDDPRLLKASRMNKAGWVYVHLEGSPSEIGFQHGYLLAPEIDTTIQAVSYALEHLTHYNWKFYRSAARNFLWKNVDREYKDEINGIVA